MRWVWGRTQRGEGCPLRPACRGDPGARSHSLGWNSVPSPRKGSLQPSPAGQTPKAACSQLGGGRLSVLRPLLAVWQTVVLTAGLGGRSVHLVYNPLKGKSGLVRGSVRVQVKMQTCDPGAPGESTTISILSINKPRSRRSSAQGHRTRTEHVSCSGNVALKPLGVKV